jgi:hypothetical protein
MRITMKRTIQLLTLGLLIIALALVGCATAASDTASEHVIQTAGTGNVIGTPDRAQVTFAVQTENSDVKIAQTENAQKMATVHDALVAAGIPDDALKTTGYNIYPVYEDSTGILKPKIKTYQVTNRLTVTLHDVNQTGEVIDVGRSERHQRRPTPSSSCSRTNSPGTPDRSPQGKQSSRPAKSDADTVAAAMGTTITGVKRADISGRLLPGRLLPELCRMISVPQQSPLPRHRFSPAM